MGVGGTQGRGGGSGDETNEEAEQMPGLLKRPGECDECDECGQSVKPPLKSQYYLQDILWWPQGAWAKIKTGVGKGPGRPRGRVTPARFYFFILYFFFSE